MPTCVRFCGSLSPHFCTWTAIFSFIILPESLFALDKHAWATVRTILISCFGLPRFHAVPCLVFIHLHSNTNRQCLSIVWYRLIFLASLFSASTFIFLPHIINSSPTRFKIFNIYHKTAKTLYTFFCASSRVLCWTCPPPYTFIHTALINPFFYSSVLFRFTPPLVHYYPLYHLHPCSLLMLTTFSVVMQFCVS